MTLVGISQLSPSTTRCADAATFTVVVSTRLVHTSSHCSFKKQLCMHHWLICRNLRSRMHTRGSSTPNHRHRHQAKVDLMSWLLTPQISHLALRCFIAHCFKAWSFNQDRISATVSDTSRMTGNRFKKIVPNLTGFING